MAKGLTKTHKIMIWIAVISITASFLAPVFGKTLEGRTDLPEASKRVNCDVTIRNPTFSDKFSFDGIECVSRSSPFCSLPFSLSALSIRQPDQLTLEISSSGQLAKRKVLTVGENVISGSLTDAEIEYCIPKDSEKVKLRLLNENKVETDSREVIV